jgi:hypothetical protein
MRAGPIAVSYVATILLPALAFSRFTEGGVGDEALPGEPVGDVAGQPREARAVGADQGVLPDLPVPTIGDERRRL